MKNLKVLISVAVIAAILGSLLCCFAASEEKYAYVNISDGKSVVAAMEKVPYADKDNDGKWTVNDVLIAVHESKCKDGYATVTSDYGPMITKLWGVENGGSYGYYLNNAMAMSLTDEIKSGDVLYAYVYADAAGYSDAYSFFDKASFENEGGNKVTLKLSYVSGFDESYAPVISALEGATVIVDGKKAEVKTAADGSAEITLPKKTAVITAEKEGLTLVPPVCVSFVASSGSSLLWLWIILAVVIVALVCFCVIKAAGRKKAE